MNNASVFGYAYAETSNEEAPRALRAGGKGEVIKGNLSLRDREFLPAAEGTCP